MLHQEIKATAEKLGLSGKLPHLEESAARSSRLIDQARSSLSDAFSDADTPLDAVLFGSIGRREATDGSDFDCLVIAHQLPPRVGQTRELLERLEELRANLGFAKAGPSGLFNTVISAPDLTERIGLDEDTNRTLSRRVLLLQESVSIYKPELRRTLIEKIVERYLSDRINPKSTVPRFLLNDVVRYWRTIAVDYQAKRWEGRAKNWGLRYLKLIISRKIAFAGTLTSLLLAEEASTSYFTEQFEMPALARLCQLEKEIHSEKQSRALAEVLMIAEEFQEALATGLRKEAESVVSLADMDPESAFGRMHSRSRELQAHLETLFFEIEPIGLKTKKYLVF